jgi:DNA-directed RNA polymerase specialized sigma subunit
MKELCNKCDKRLTCSKICKIVEEYINQDYINQQELPIDDVDSYSTEDNILWENVKDNFSIEHYNYLVDSYKLTDKQKEILYMIFVEGKKQTDVAEVLKITKQSIRKHLLRIGIKLKKRLTSSL